MSQHPPDQPTPEPGERTADGVTRGRLARRRERIRAEIKRNRGGGHTVPTWVLALILVLILAGWGYVIVTS
jgi:hypothetical protein